MSANEICLAVVFGFSGFLIGLLFGVWWSTRTRATYSDRIEDANIFDDDWNDHADRDSSSCEYHPDYWWNGGKKPKYEE